MRSAHAAFTASLALIVASCATTGGGGSIGGNDPVRSTVYETHRLVQNLERELGGSVERLNETTADLLARIEASDRETRRLLSVAEENQVKLEQLQRSLDDLTDTIYKQFNLTPPVRPGQRRSTFVPPPRDVDIQRGGIVVQPPDDREQPPPRIDTTPPPLDSNAHYRQAQELYTREEYQQALQQFGAHLALFPNTRHAANAQYWKAHCHFKLGEYEPAIDEFQRLRTLYPDSGKVPTAMHNQAVSFSRLGQIERAIDLFKDLILEYPNDVGSESAREKLRQLQGAN